MNDKLLPCPFCGGDVEIDYLQGFGMDSGNWINCTRCNRSLVYADMKGIDYWNHRVYPPEVQAVIDAAVKWNYCSWDDFEDAIDELAKSIECFRATQEREP